MHREECAPGTCLFHLPKWNRDHFLAADTYLDSLDAELLFYVDHGEGNRCVNYGIFGRALLACKPHWKPSIAFCERFCIVPNDCQISSGVAHHVSRNFEVSSCVRPTPRHGYSGESIGISVNLLAGLEIAGEIMRFAFCCIRHAHVCTVRAGRRSIYGIYSSIASRRIQIT